MDNCANCRFSMMGVRGDPAHGLCRRYPPNDENRWSEITGGDWCGEHQPIERVGISHGRKKVLVEVQRGSIVERNPPND